MPDTKSKLGRSPKSIPTQWKPGQSGNPKGRPRGSGRLQKAVARQVEIAAQLSLASDARQALQDKSLEITKEVIQLALQREDRETLAQVRSVLTKMRVSKYRPEGLSLELHQVVLQLVKELEKEVVPSKAKVQCLLACMDKLVPSLKTVEVKSDEATRRLEELSDGEIMLLMNRMVTLAQQGKAYRKEQLEAPETEDYGPS